MMTRSVLQSAICCIGFFVISSVIADHQPKLALTDHYTKLVKDLFENYSTTVLPLANRSQPINVKLGIYLRSLNWLSTRHDKQSVSFFIRKRWWDPRLKWNTSQYDGLSAAFVEPSKLWKPDIVVINSLTGGLIRAGLARIDYRGHVIWALEVRYLTHCGMDVSSFPFDIQTCVVDFASWNHGPHLLNISLPPSGASMLSSAFVKNKEWTLISANVTYNIRWSYYQFITVTLRWKRHSTMPQHLLFLPAVFISITCPFVFLLPPNSNHKITLGVITILCMLSLEWFLMDWMPRAATTVPYIAKFLFLTLAMSVISLIVSVIVIGMSKRGPRTNRVPGFFRTWMFQGLKKLVFLGDVDYTHLNSKQMSMNGIENPMADGEKALTKLDRDTDFVGKQVKMLATRASGLELQGDIKNEWRLLAMVIDRLMFVIYAFIFIVAALAIFS